MEKAKHTLTNDKCHVFISLTFKSTQPMYAGEIYHSFDRSLLKSLILKKDLLVYM